ncbi:MAG: aminoacyl-tRNA hydrolase [bacterium]
MNYLVVGLGNPGKEYQKTRHNAGWVVIDSAYPDLFWERDNYAVADIAKQDAIIFAKPATFMNLSGESVGYLTNKKDIDPDQCIVIYDDIDLPLGKLKISYDRGSGGHNGIKSIQDHLGTAEFIRIRIGISKLMENGELVKPNVLGKFEPEELEILESVAQRVKLAIHTIIKDGKEFTMTEFNSLDPHIKLLKQ